MNSTKQPPENHEKVFVRLMLQGKISAALKWNGSQRSGLLDATPDVIETLISKHPQPAAALDGSVLKGPIQEVEDIIFASIDGDLKYYTTAKIGVFFEATLVAVFDLGILTADDFLDRIRAFTHCCLNLLHTNAP